MKVSELLEYCQNAVDSGFGDKQVYISEDDEGNGFHKLHYEFTSEPDDIEVLIKNSRVESGDGVDNIILLG